MEFVLFSKPNQAAKGSVMKCPDSGSHFTVKRRGKVEGRVGILIQFSDDSDIAVVDAKNKWFVSGVAG